MLRGSLAPLHSTADSTYMCAWRETDWGEGITTTTVSLQLFICLVSRLALYPLPRSPRRVLLSTSAPADSSLWLSCGRRRLLIISDRVSRPKKYRPIPILPNICKYRPIPNNPIPVSFEPYFHLGIVTLPQF